VATTQAWRGFIGIGLALESAPGCTKGHLLQPHALAPLRQCGRWILDYRQRSSAGEWEPMKYRMPQDFTRCQFGGRVLACCHCHRLTYRCQRETDDDRATRLGLLGGRVEDADRWLRDIV
jgi:hypothetical protein